LELLNKQENRMMFADIAFSLESVVNSPDNQDVPILILVNKIVT